MNLEPGATKLLYMPDALEFVDTMYQIARRTAQATVAHDTISYTGEYPITVATIVSVPSPVPHFNDTLVTWDSARGWMTFAGKVTHTAFGQTTFARNHASIADNGTDNLEIISWIVAREQSHGDLRTQ